MNQAPRGNRPIGRGEVTALILIAILAVATIVAGFTVLQLPEPVTEQAKRTHNLYQPVLVISLIVFFGVTSGIIWAIFRFRRRSNDEVPEQVHGSSKLEFTWTVIPVLILVGLFIPSLILLLDLKIPPDDADVDVEIEAVGHQWWWEFIYPDAGVRVQQTPPNYEALDPPRMVVPVGQTILVRVRSTDVIHSFSAPNTLYKLQAIPGNVNTMHFKAEKIGEYYGQCYQFCGLRHSNMLFILDVRSQADYNRWLSETRRAQGLTDRPADAAQTAGSSGASKSE